MSNATLARLENKFRAMVKCRTDFWVNTQGLMLTVEAIHWVWRQNWRQGRVENPLIRFESTINITIILHWDLVDILSDVWKHRLKSEHCLIACPYEQWQVALATHCSCPLDTSCHSPHRHSSTTSQITERRQAPQINWRLVKKFSEAKQTWQEIRSVTEHKKIQIGDWSLVWRAIEPDGSMRCWCILSDRKVATNHRCALEAVRRQTNARGAISLTRSRSLSLIQAAVALVARPSCLALDPRARCQLAYLPSQHSSILPPPSLADNRTSLTTHLHTWPRSSRWRRLILLSRDLPSALLADKHRECF